MVEGAGFDWRLFQQIVVFILRAVRRHRRLSATCCLGGIALGAAGVAIVPFKYRADAVVLVRPNPLTPSRSVNRELEEPIRNARETLLQRENLLGVATKIGLVDRYLEKRPVAVRLKNAVIQTITGRESKRGEILDGLVDTLEDRLVVQAYADTLRISFTWWDAEIAYEVVQEALNSYLGLRREAEIEAIGDLIAVLESNRAPLEAQIGEQLEALAKSFEEERRQPASGRSALRRARSTSRELARIESALAGRVQAARELETAREQRIAELEAEIVRLQHIYAADHPALTSARRLLESLSGPSPRVLELQGEIESLEGALQKVTEHVGIEEESYLGLDPRTAYGFRKLDQLLADQANLTARIGDARLEYETARRAFEKRYSVVEPPRPPNKPIKPYGPAIMIAGVLGGLVFGVFAATVVDLRSGLALERWQVEHQLALPVIGEITSP